MARAITRKRKRVSYYRFNTHVIGPRGRCIWRLYYNALLLTRSPKGVTFESFEAAASHAKTVLMALRAIGTVRRAI